MTMASERLKDIRAQVDRCIKTDDVGGYSEIMQSAEFDFWAVAGASKKRVYGMQSLERALTLGSDSTPKAEPPAKKKGRPPKNTDTAAGPADDEPQGATPALPEQPPMTDSERFFAEVAGSEFKPIAFKTKDDEIKLAARFYELYKAAKGNKEEQDFLLKMSCECLGRPLVPEKTSFILHNDCWDNIKHLSLTERGELMTAIFEHVNTGSTGDIESSGVRVAFSFIKAQLERDKVSYHDACVVRWINGIKGGRPKKNLD
jgi:hypothetical protein